MNNDLLTIGGAAFLSGALNVSYLDGFNARIGDTFTILTAAGGVSGKFASFQDAHASGTLLGLQVIYQPNAVLLRFTQGSFAGLAPVLTPNELQVARALDQLAANQPNNALIRELDGLPLGQLPGALSLLSPEDFAAIFTSGFAISQVQIGNLEHRLSDVRQDAGYAVTNSHGAQNYDGKSSLGLEGKESKEVVQSTVEREDRWGFFISGTGERGDLESTSFARGSDFTTGGVTVGADYRVTRHLVLGAAIGYANTSSDLSREGNLDINSGKGSLYATLYEEGFYLNGIVGAGYSSLDTRRRTVGGFARGDTTRPISTACSAPATTFTMAPSPGDRWHRCSMPRSASTASRNAARWAPCGSTRKARTRCNRRWASEPPTAEGSAMWCLHPKSARNGSTSISTVIPASTPDLPPAIRSPCMARKLAGRAPARCRCLRPVEFAGRDLCFLHGELGRENYTIHSVQRRSARQLLAIPSGVAS